jgi:hypothetical protein
MRSFVVCVGLVAACSQHPADSTVDAARADSGTGSETTVDAPPVVADAPGSGAACAGLAYCDDFDGYGTVTLTNGETLGPWAVAVSAVTMTIDSVNAYDGGNSLHITMPAGVNSHTGGTPTHGLLSQGATAGLVTGNDLYGRAMIYYSNTGENNLPLSVHSWFFEASGTSTKLAASASLNLGGGGAKLQLNYAPGDLSVQGGTMTAGAWHCVQWQYDGAGTTPANVAKVWIDGTVALDILASQGWSFATPWDAFSFGFTHYQTLANPVEVFLDDFALDGAMIPCPT